jgi:hypothetical protein
MKRITFIVFSILPAINCWKEPQIPNHETLVDMESTKIPQDPLFVAALKEASGYYLDDKRNPKLNNTIIITAFNHGYLEFFHNFKCYAKRIGIKFLTIAFDAKAQDHLMTTEVFIATLLLM